MRLAVIVFGFFLYIPLVAYAEDAVVSLDVAADITALEHKTKLPQLSPYQYLQNLKVIWADDSIKHDIDPDLFNDFWLKWELVTTRYKPDGEELRFMYTNKIGAETLGRGEYPFPEGTIFTKIGAHAVQDPIFDNSLVPQRINRIQVMLKKPSDPNARDGWVYSLYTPTPNGERGGYMGHLTPDEIDACHACHTVAAKRDFVFSQPFPGPFGAAPAADDAALPFAGMYKTKQTTELSPQIQEMLSKADISTATVELLEIPAFQGTVVESRELLARMARRNGKTYVLSSPNGSVALVASPNSDAKNNSCVDMVTYFGAAVSSPTLAGKTVFAWRRCDSGISHKRLLAGSVPK